MIWLSSRYLKICITAGPYTPGKTSASSLLWSVHPHLLCRLWKNLVSGYWQLCLSGEILRRWHAQHSLLAWVFQAASDLFAAVLLHSQPGPNLLPVSSWFSEDMQCISIWIALKQGSEYLKEQVQVNPKANHFSKNIDKLPYNITAATPLSSSNVKYVVLNISCNVQFT